MQDTEKQLNGIIDLTQNFTIGAKKKYDSNFHPDSPEYYFFEISDEDKLKIFFEKVNKLTSIIVTVPWNTLLKRFLIRQKLNYITRKKR